MTGGMLRKSECGMRALLRGIAPVLSAESGGGGPVSVSNNAFDMWLERKLHEMFDGVTLEPMPPDLLELLNQFGELDQPANN